MIAPRLPPSILAIVVRYFLLSILCLFAACSKQAGDHAPDANVADAVIGAANRAADSAESDDSDCNLQTVLKEGIPGSPGNLMPSERNPNGESELAHLMRVFVDGLRDARLLVEVGEKVEPLFPVHRKMRCAWPTNPSDRNEGYDARAQTYLLAVRAFDVAPDKSTYNAIINNCVACHQVSCSGVIEFIDSLRWQ